MTPLPSILAAVCDRFVVLPDEVLARDKRLRVTRPRLVTYHLANEDGHSFCEIARFFSRRHDTVLRGKRKIESDINIYPHIALAVADVRDRLENGDE